MRTLTATGRPEAGFTLVEILAVILIVGILAAIAVPSLLGQRDRGQDADAKSAVAAVGRAMEVYNQSNDDSYACGTSAECLVALRDIEAEIPSAGVVISHAGGLSGNATSSAYRVTVTGGDGRTFWQDTMRSGTGRGCDLNGARSPGGCSAGSW
jgi:type IV pilus assembly protein PilA